jgi:hypothetical protein
MYKTEACKYDITVDSSRGEGVGVWGGGAKETARRGGGEGMAQ